MNILPENELWDSSKLSLIEIEEYIKVCKKVVPTKMHLHEDLLLMWLNYCDYDRTKAVDEL